MKSILKLTSALVLPFTLLSCGEKEEKTDSSNTPDKEQGADSHAAVTEEYLALGSEFGEQLGALKDKASAEKVAEAISGMRPKLESLLERAKALPAPTEEQIAAIKKGNEEIEAAMTEKMMALQKRMTETPPSEEDMMAIQKTMQEMMVGEDGKKIEELTRKIEAIYGIEKEAAE